MRKRLVSLCLLSSVMLVLSACGEKTDDGNANATEGGGYTQEQNTDNSSESDSTENSAADSANSEIQVPETQVSETQVIETQMIETQMPETETVSETVEESDVVPFDDLMPVVAGIYETYTMWDYSDGRMIWVVSEDGIIRDRYGDVYGTVTEHIEDGNMASSADSDCRKYRIDTRDGEVLCDFYRTGDYRSLSGYFTDNGFPIFFELSYDDFEGFVEKDPTYTDDWKESESWKQLNGSTDGDSGNESNSGSSDAVAAESGVYSNIVGDWISYELEDYECGHGEFYMTIQEDGSYVLSYKDSDMVIEGSISSSEDVNPASNFTTSEGDEIAYDAGFDSFTYGSYGMYALFVRR